MKPRSMRLVGQLCLMNLFLSLASLAAADPAYQVKIVPDRKDAIYEVGNEAKFLISVTKGNENVPNATVKFVVDDFLGSGETAGFPAGTVTTTDQPGAVTVIGKQAGFLRCQVTFDVPEGKPIQAAAGAAFSPTKIGLSLPVPDDFDHFWAEQKKQLAAIPLEPQLTRADQPGMKDDLECFDVQVKCLGDVPVSGYLARPKNAKPKSLPAILWVHGAGVRSSSSANALQGAKHGMLSLDINAHGIPNGKPAEFYTELTEGRLKDYRAAGRDSRETSYFKGMFLRLVRAIDFLTSQPEWDGKVVVVIGHSQGGGQALVAGGIDPRVTLIASGVPAICDHSGRVAGRINGWPKLVPDGADGKPDARILEASRYVDAVSFATRCKAEAILSVGFVDAVCPPSSCYAAFNALQGPKEMINEPLMNHAAPAHIQEAFLAHVLDHVKRHSSEK